MTHANHLVLIMFILFLNNFSNKNFKISSNFAVFSFSCFLLMFRKWIVDQLKGLHESDAGDSLKDGQDNDNDPDIQQRSKRGPGYDISDDEGSSGSDQDKSPVDLDEAAQVPF